MNTMRYYMGSHVFSNKEIDRTRELTVVCTLPNEEMSLLISSLGSGGAS